MRVEKIIPVVTLASDWHAKEVVQVTERRKRWYEVTCHDEVNEEQIAVRLPSVTTVLDKVYPRPALTNWAAKKSRDGVRDWLLPHVGEPLTVSLLDDAVEKGGKLAAKKESSAARDLGTLAHTMIDEYLRGRTQWEDSEDSDELRPVMQAFLDWKGSQDLKLVDTECAVYFTHPDHPTHGYAGQVDALWEKPDGSLLLTDWKTSKAVYDNYHTQLAAYGAALTWLAPVRGVNVNMEIIRLGKEEAEFEAVPVIEIDKHVEIWRAALDFYAALQQ